MRCWSAPQVRGDVDDPLLRVLLADLVDALAVMVQSPVWIRLRSLMLYSASHRWGTGGAAGATTAPCRTVRGRRTWTGWRSAPTGSSSSWTPRCGPAASLSLSASPVCGTAPQTLLAASTARGKRRVPPPAPAACRSPRSSPSRCLSPRPARTRRNRADAERRTGCPAHRLSDVLRAAARLPVSRPTADIAATAERLSPWEPSRSPRPPWARSAPRSAGVLLSRG